ncbi:MAG: pilus assembly protein TadG-related protein [Nitrospinota bacterium]
MERGVPTKRIIRKWIRRLASDARGQTLVIVGLALPVLIGGGAIAVDVGYMFVAKGVMQTAADAGARAGGAILAQGGTQGEAQTEALNYVNQNLNSVTYLTGAVSTITFPTPESVKVNLSHALPLFFAPFIRVDAVTVTTGATPKLFPVSAIAPGNLVPFGIYCNNAAGCSGQLGVLQSFAGMLRHCGNVFGASGSACNYSPNTPLEGEIFLTGLSFNDNNSNGELKDEVENGYSGTATIGQVLGALSGMRQGWQPAMRNRLNAGENEMTFTVLAPADPGSGTVKIVDFVQVRIDAFRSGSANSQDQFDFQIIPRAVSSNDFATSDQGLGIGSVQGVRLIQ